MVKYYVNNIFSLLFLVIICQFLISCSNSRNNNFKKNHTFTIKDRKSFNTLTEQFTNNIENMWGLNEVKIIGSTDYLKYTDEYKTRSHINFNKGIITIETIARNNSIKYLRQSIINTLLMINNDYSIDSYYIMNNNNYINNSINNKLLFYSKVINNKDKLIQFESYVKHFADFLLKNKLQIRTDGLRQIRFIIIKLVPKLLNKRAYKYLSIIREASKEYGIDQSLILAIIQIESNFNPYAVSHTNALGLMQITQYNAGRDVFKMKGMIGQPSRNFLLNPKNNIDMGTAYLAILQNKYLIKITNPVSRRYAVISSYNSGVGRILRIFSQDKDTAFQIINTMSPIQVYKILSMRHPSAKSSHYLHSVDSLQKKFQYQYQLQF